jgi:hypothetical protein
MMVTQGVLQRKLATDPSWQGQVAQDCLAREGVGQAVVVCRQPIWLTPDFTRFEKP